MMTRFSLMLAPLFLLTATVRGGQMSPDLDQQVQSAAAGQKIRVWIKLPTDQTVRSARAASSLAQASANEQHRVAIVSLKEGNGISQAGLVKALDDLATLNKADSIKPHWLVNVVEASVDASELAAIASRSDVESVIQEPKISLIAPESATPAPVDQLAPKVSFYTPNLTQIKADQAHSAGYTGKGRVICTFDTGVQGTHPFLNQSWRGKGGTTADSLASWFDPLYHQHSPHVIANSTSQNHGTHVMGIVVGRNVAGDSTIGVAPDAKWISAAVIDDPGASILDGFEWAADPDGDPSTSDDMPDVINHSWGYNVAYQGCGDIFFDAIDNLEALGIVNIFAAGNEGGSGAGTIRNPANRALDSLDCFAAGNLDATGATPTIAGTSSRGPSVCNGAIKPNVVAPGSLILSSWPDGSFATQTGTSMASPHVAGLVALLRQKNPSATPDQIKQAILISTQHNAGWGWGTLPNNSYGWGEIDCLAALNALAAPVAPFVRLEEFVHGTVAPGATVTGKLRVKNLGGAVKNFTAQITGSNPSLTIVDGLASFSGNILQDSTKASTDSIIIHISDTVTVGQILSVEMTLSGNYVSTSAAYSRVISLSVMVEPASAKSFVIHNANDITFTVTDFGVYGLGSGSLFPAGGSGFLFQGDQNDLYEAGLIVAADSFSLATGVHDQLFEPPHDFLVAPGGNLTLSEPGTIASQESHSKFTDGGAKQPLGLEITQDSYVFGSLNGFVLMRFIVKNTTGSAVPAVRFGLFMDWDPVSYNMDCGAWNGSDSILWEAYNAPYSDGQGAMTAPNTMRGMRMLEGTPSTALTELGSIAYMGPGSVPPNGLTAGEKWKSLIAGFGTATFHQHDSADLFQLMATTLGLAAGESDTVVFAILAGRTYADIQAAGVAAKGAYDANFQIAPESFSCLRPQAGAGSPVPTLLPTFVWSRAVDPNAGDTVKYRLEYALDSLFSSPVTINDITDTSYTATSSLLDLTDYWWRVVAFDQTGLFRASTNSPGFRVDVSTGVDDGDHGALPKSFALFQNYPNPFNPTTVISFDLPRASDYRLDIFDVLGRSRKQVAGHSGAGRVEIVWDGSGAASGVYFYQVTAGEFGATRKMLLLK